MPANGAASKGAANAFWRLASRARRAPSLIPPEARAKGKTGNKSVGAKERARASGEER
jgi:hypothetical protein